MQQNRGIFADRVEQYRIFEAGGYFAQNVDAFRLKDVEMNDGCPPRVGALISNQSAICIRPAPCQHTDTPLAFLSIRVTDGLVFGACEPMGEISIEQALQQFNVVAKGIRQLAAYIGGHAHALAIVL